MCNVYFVKTKDKLPDYELVIKRHCTYKLYFTIKVKMKLNEFTDSSKLF